MKNLVLIDGNSLLNRAFYGMRPLTTRSGTPTNAVFGFVKLLLKLYNEALHDPSKQQLVPVVITCVDPVAF